MTYYVYMIANEMNNKVYIGSTNRTPSIRFSVHIWDAENRPSSSMHYDIDRYGKDKFAVFELKQVETKEEARILEAKYQLEYDSVRNGYNKEYAVDKSVAFSLLLDIYHK